MNVRCWEIPGDLRLETGKGGVWRVKGLQCPTMPWSPPTKAAIFSRGITLRNLEISCNPRQASAPTWRLATIQWSSHIFWTECSWLWATVWMKDSKEKYVNKLRYRKKLCYLSLDYPECLDIWYHPERKLCPLQRYTSACLGICTPSFL